MEGWLAGSFGELDNPNRSASWHFSNALDGTLYQHYALSVSCWASGNYEANTRYVAIESEGVAGTPLNDAQRTTFVRLARELGFTRRGTDLFEHNEVATLWSPNAGPTACPSHRYDAAFAALTEDEDMPDPRVDKLIAALTGLKDQAAIDRLDKWNLNGNSLLDGYAEVYTDLYKHLDEHENGRVPLTDIPEHEHTDGTSGPVRR